MNHKIRHDFAQKIFGRMNGQAVVELGCYHRGDRTVAEIVEQDPGLVSEVWCRKIFRQLLLFLERQYAMQLPHRAITPDTVVVRDNGEPMVLPTKSDPRPDVAKDLTALASVIHYAITRERASTRPLRGRALKDYSDSIIAAVDRSMTCDPAARPHTIDELRIILGIVALKEVRPARITDTQVPPRSLLPGASRPVRQPLSGKSQSRWAPWTLVGSSAAILFGIALAIVGGSRDFVPQASDVAREDTSAKLPATAVPVSVPASLAAPDATAPLPASPAYAIRAEVSTGSTDEIAGASPPPATGTRGGTRVKKNPTEATLQAFAARKPVNPPQQKVIANESAQSAHSAQRQLLPEAGAAGNTVLNLQIQPWGVVYVDGINRGVSPPMKRLTVSPGRHKIQVKNPISDTRVLEVDTTSGDRRIAVDFTQEPE